MFFKNVQLQPISQPPPPPPVQNMNQNDIYIDDELDSFVFAADENNTLPVIDLKTPKIEKDQLMIESPNDQVEISKSLRHTDIEMISDPKEITYIKTVPNTPKKQISKKSL